MAKTLKLIDAGAIQVAALYNRCSPRDTAQQRKAKHQASSEAQRRMNQIYSAAQLELMLALNFPTPGSGIVAVVTFDDAHMPRTRAEAQRRMKYFLKLLRAERAAEGLPEPVVFWAPEILTSEDGRWHFHCVIDATGRDYDMIRRCWIYGSDVDLSKLRKPDPREAAPVWYRPDDLEPGNIYRPLARYMTKELRECQEYEAKPGLHGWSCTRNARRPETETVTVPDDYQLEPPQDATVLLDRRESTIYAGYRVVKWCFPALAFAPAPRARRRRPPRR